MARGSIYQRGDRFYIRYDIEPDEATGRRRQRSGARGGYATEQEAHDALTVARAAVIAGTHVDPSRQTFGAYAARWLEVVAGKVSAQSVERYRSDLALHILPRLGALRLASVRRSHVNAALAHWARAGLAPQTCAQLYDRLRQIFRAAVEDGELASSPIRREDRPRIPRREGVAWTPAQLARFLELAASDADYPLWRLYAHAGLRRSEACGLRWRDVDWGRRLIRVEQQLLTHGGPLRPGPPKSARGRRAIELDEETLRVLAEHRRAQNARRLAHPAWREFDLVFCGPDGSMRHPVAVGWRFTAMLAHWPELPRLTLHGLRHTFATHLLQAGVDVRVAAEILGHDPALLLHTYAHVIGDARQRAMGRYHQFLAASEQHGTQAGDAR